MLKFETLVSAKDKVTRDITDKHAYCLNCSSLQRVSKNDADFARYNFDVNQPILIIPGINISQSLSYHHHHHQDRFMTIKQVNLH